MKSRQNLRDGLPKPRWQYPEYHAWRMAMARCHNPKARAYADYGGRGITMCQRWRESFAAFLEDMGERPSSRHELDRKDNDGHYEPGNCRWVQRFENDRNRRSSRWVTYHGTQRLFIELCEEKGIWFDTARWRINKGWTVEEAFDTPAKKYRSARGPQVVTAKTLAMAA